MEIKVNNLAAFALVGKTYPMKVNSLSGMVLIAPIPKMRVANLGVFALVKQNNPLPTNDTGHDSLEKRVDMRVDETLLPEGVAPGDVTFTLGKPTPFEGEDGRNTVIRATSTNDKLPGHRDFYYRRVPISRIKIQTTLVVTSETTTHQMLDKINEAILTKIVAEDIVDSPISGNTMTLVAAEDSVYFLPGSMVVVSLM